MQKGLEEAGLGDSAGKTLRIFISKDIFKE